MGGKVGENPAALRAAVFFAILEKPEGGGAFKCPPPAGRGLIQVTLILRHVTFDLRHLTFIFI